jgi:hypothetical protein
MADPAENLVPVIDPDGEPAHIPASQLQEALAHDYSLPPNPDENIGNQAGAAAEGFAQGLIPGAPSLESALLPKAGSIEEQQKRKALFPGTHLAGEIGGGVAQLAGVAELTGGASELLPAAEVTQDVLKGGDTLAAVKAAGATPEAINAGVDAAVTRGPQTLKEASAILPYAQQTAAGAANNATNYINEAELGDHDFNGEGLAQSVGIGALMGAAGEGGAQLFAKKILPPVLEKAGNVLDTAGNGLKNAFVKASEFVNPELRGKIGPAVDAAISEAKPLENEGFTDFANNADKAVKAMDEASQAQFDQFHPQEVEQALKDVPVSQVLGTAEQPGLRNVADGIEQDLGRISQRFGGETGPGMRPFKDVANAFDTFKAAISDPEATANDLHQATVDMRRAVDKAGVNAVREDGGLLADLKQSVRDPLRDALNSPEMFGAAAAQRNEAVNKAFTNMLNSGKNVFGDLGKKEWNEFSQKGWVADPAKVRNLFSGDPLTKQMKLGHLNDYLDDAKTYLDEIKKSAGAAGQVVPGGSDLEDLLKTLTEQRRAAQAYAPISAIEGRFNAGGGEGLGGLGVLGYGAHALGLSVPGAGAVAAGYGLLKNPVNAARMYAKIAGAAAATRDVVNSGVRKIFSSTPIRAAVTGTVNNALRGLTFTSPNGAPSGQDFAKQAKHISELAADPGRQMDNLSKNTADLSEAAPNTSLSMQSAAVRALTVLRGALPQNPSPSMLPSENKDWKPNDTQLQAWNDLHQAVLDPASYLKRMQDGTADPNVWASLQTVYPKWTAQVQQSTIAHLTSHPKLELDPTQALHASLILGAPVSPTVAPDQVAFQQQQYAQAMAGAPATKPRAKGLDKLDLGARSAPGHQRSK